MILNVNMLNEKLNYIHDNPVRRGYLDDSAHWRYSSFIDYYEGVGLLPVEMIDSHLRGGEYRKLIRQSRNC
jgi:hypothetical protein